MATTPTPRWGADERKAYKRTTRMRRLLMLSPFMTLVAAVAAVVSLAGTASTSGSSATDPVVAVASSLAEQAVVDWVEQGGLPPGSMVMAPTDTSVRTATSSDAGGTFSVTLVTVRIPVLSGKAVPVVSATVSFSSRTGVYTLLGSPSLDLTPDSWQGSSQDNPWPGTSTQACPSSVAPAVQAWVTAYFSGDPVRLQQAVGDPDPTHHYVPVTGATVDVPTVRLCTPITDQGVITATVTVPLSWTQPDSTGTSSQHAAPVSAGFDVRVDGASGLAATVTAWGPVGTGLDFAKFSNATTAVVVVSAPSGSPSSATPSPSPAPEGSPTAGTSADTSAGAEPEPGAATTGQ